MANNYIAMKDDIPTDYNLGKRSKKSTNVLMDYLKDDDEFQIVEGGSIVERDNTQIVPINKIQSVVKDIEEAEDDFKLARENIKDMLEQSKDIMEEYTELVKGTDAPRAFEVFSKMALSHAELAKNLMDLHEQKQKLKQTSSANPPEASSTTNIGNQQNIMVSPAELVKMLKNESN
jgi:hypothetical protein